MFTSFSNPASICPVIMRLLKGRTARPASCILGRCGEPFWRDESYDHWIRSTDELREIVAYVENRPVKAGLREFATDWPWSSARRRADDKKRSSAPRVSSRDTAQGVS